MGIGHIFPTGDDKCLLSVDMQWQKNEYTSTYILFFIFLLLKFNSWNTIIEFI